MNLCTQTELINDMVRENPDTTIKEYLELVRDLEGIRATNGSVDHLVLLKKIRIPVKINKNISERYKQMNIAHKL